MSEDDEYLERERREAREYRRGARRRQSIEHFCERQRTLRQWIALDEIADWCARSVTGADATTEERARSLAYQRLDQSARDGEFEALCRGRMQSKILYLHPRQMGDGKDRRWLTREKLSYTEIRNQASFSWLPRDLAQQWLAAHGYPWPTHFDPVAATIPAASVTQGSAAESGCARSEVATGPAPTSDDFRPATDDKIDDAITAVYDEAARIGSKPPNIKELPKLVSAKLDAIGFVASGALIMKIGDRPAHKKRRRKPGKTIASEKRKADFKK
jgi:hypothetical protein